MKYLSLKLPGSDVNIPVPPGFKYSGESANFGAVLSDFLTIVFYIAMFLAFFWLVWGAFQYMVAGGNKQSLASARSRITWALIGLILVAIAYSITLFVGDVLKPKEGIPLL